MPLPPENPFVFGEIVDDTNFVNRTEELRQLVRDLADGQKIFLLSPRRFGKSSLVSVAMPRLKKRHIRTVSLTVSSYSSYTQFLEKFAEKVLRAAGPWNRVKDWVTRFGRQVKPELNYNMNTGEVSVSLGRGEAFDPAPIAPDVFALPGELTKNAGFRMAICLDEFQQISQFNGGSVENALRNQVQEQREVGYVFAGSQPSLMREMLSSQRPFNKAGPQMFLDKIDASDWKEFITRQFRKRGRSLDEAALKALLNAADLIPYDVQRIAHELWDHAELRDKRRLDASDVHSVTADLVTSQSTYYELLWDQLSARQRAALQALANHGVSNIYSQQVRDSFRLGPASTVQKSLQSLDSRDVLDRYKGTYFFIDPLFPSWIRKRGA
ncbi:MAG: ATP-binding protein [Terracidiphilus sp.]